MREPRLQPPRVTRAGLACVLSCALACGASQSTQSTPNTSPPPTARMLSGPAAVAIKWLNALGGDDLPALNALTHFAFQLRDTGSEGHCANATAATAAELATTLVCVREDELLIAQLQANPTPPAEALAPGSLPAWAKRWGRELSNDATAVQVSIVSSGNSFRFVVIVERDGVAGFWKDASLELN